MEGALEGQAPGAGEDDGQGGRAEGYGVLVAAGQEEAVAEMDERDGHGAFAGAVAVLLFFIPLTLLGWIWPR